MKPNLELWRVSGWLGKVIVELVAWDTVTPILEISPGGV